MRLIIIILFVNICIVNDIKSQEINSSCESFILNNDIYFKITIDNNSRENIFLPLSEWIILGDSLTNSIFGCIMSPSYSLNRVFFFPSEYDEIYCGWDAHVEVDKFKYLSSFLKISANEKGYLNLKIKFSDTLVKLFNTRSFNFEFMISYCGESSMKKIKNVIPKKIRSKLIINSLAEIIINHSKNEYVGYPYVKNYKLNQKISRIVNRELEKCIIVKCKLN